MKKSQVLNLLPKTTVFYFHLEINYDFSICASVSNMSSFLNDEWNILLFKIQFIISLHKLQLYSREVECGNDSSRIKTNEWTFWNILAQKSNAPELSTTLASLVTNYFHLASNYVLLTPYYSSLQILHLN